MLAVDLGGSISEFADGKPDSALSPTERALRYNESASLLPALRNFCGSTASPSILVS